MTEFIFHELERAVLHTMRVISEVGATPTSVSTLKDQLQTLHKRVAAFDELTGEKRQTKTRFRSVRTSPGGSLAITNGSSRAIA